MTAHPVLDAFPQRPVVVLRSPMMSPLSYILLTLMCVGFAALFPLLVASGLVRDWKISQAPVVVQDANVTDGRCTTHTVIVDCSAKVSYRVNGVTYRSEPSLLFISVGGYDQAAVVRSRDQPGLATLDIALDQLWNRVITAVCLAGLFVALLIFIPTQIPEAWRWRRLVKREVPVDGVPTIVQIRSFKTQYGKTTCNIAWDDDGRTRKAQIHMGRAKPFVVGAVGDRALALAYRAAPGDRPVLLDENLTAIEISDDERQPLWAARNAALA